MTVFVFVFDFHIWCIWSNTHQIQQLFKLIIVNNKTIFCIQFAGTHATER